MDTTGNDNNKISATKPEVYVLSGASNAGKTTTLNHLAWLVGNFPGSVQKNGPAPRAFGATGNGKDDKYCFKVTVGQSTLIVGIFTAGDRAQEISAGFAFFAAHKCDVCFIASKTSGSSVREIENTAKAGNFVPKYCFLINDYGFRTKTAIEQAAANFLFSFVK